MSIATDTDDLLSTSLWGEIMTIIRNSPGYDNAGMGADFFDVVATPNGDIQRISGNNPIRRLGQGRISTHNIFLPDGTDVKQGDRVRSSDWTPGKAVYFVEAVLADEGHVELRTKLVRTIVGELDYLLLEDGSNILLQDGSGIFLEN